jgi:hypothetical protein
VQAIQQFDPPRTVADTEIGDELVEEIAMLAALLHAYDENQISPRNE